MHVSTIFQFCLGLRALATGSPSGLVGAIHGYSASTVARSTTEVVQYLYDKASSSIVWPTTAAQMAEAATGFFEMTGKPGVVGVLGAYDVAIRRPDNATHMYLNRQGFHSLKLLV